MADNIPFESGGDGAFIVKFASKTIEIPLGSAGTLVTLSPPAGQRVKLTGLASSGTTHTNLITVSVGGNAVITNALISQPGAQLAGVGELYIGFGSYNQVPIMGGIDEDILLTTNVALSQGLFYTYQFGE